MSDKNGDDTQTKELDGPALIIEYNPETQAFRWMFTGEIPPGSLVNTLELIKSLVIDNQKIELQRQAAAVQQNQIVMAKGKLRI